MILFKKNILENLAIISCSGFILCGIIHCLTVSSIIRFWSLIYIIILFIATITFSFKFVQWLVHLSRPIKFDLEKLSKNWPPLLMLTQFLPEVVIKSTQRKNSRRVEYKEYDTNELSVITTVLERKLVSSWYIPYVSQEIGFPFACKQMLDQMVGKTFQICNKIETKEVFIDIMSILITHIKEYRKALKRYEKDPNIAIEKHYKKSHIISEVNSKKNQSAEHCISVLRLVLKELVPWELWDTPHSELLIRILAKRLNSFMNETLSDPVWINYKLLTLIKGKEEGLIVEDKIIQYDHLNERSKTVESDFREEFSESPFVVIKHCEETIVPLENMGDIVEEVDISITEPIDIKSSPVLRKRRGRQGKNEVKIYDRIIEGNVKTWETDMDLQCISLGQDLLASLDGEITLSQLWGQDVEGETTSPNLPKSKSPQPLWFGEEDFDLTETSPVKKELSPKPTDILLKDLQTTVNQAKNKIGDLQVQTKFKAIDVARKCSSDEAAGMMEGLLDFGIAGLKKGLRFTGFSDDAQEKSPLYVKEKSEENVLPMENTKIALTDSKEIISSVIQKEDNGISSVPQLVKQHRVTSQDSVLTQSKAVKPESIPSLVPLSDSPELEYEEVADLSTSIAKLRSLLQQRAENSDSSRSEDIWWDNAEETRGRAQKHHSSRPVDTATLADEYDMSSETTTHPEQSANNMQRLDKLFQRTVTGVFNSIKTAVGAEGDEVIQHPLYEWNYVCTSVEQSVGGAVARLVGSRRAYTHVDAALDSLEHLATPPPKKQIVPEDFEEWCSCHGGAWCACAELAAAIQGHAHLTHRLASALLADVAESVIEIWLEEFTTWLKAQIFVIFEQMANENEPSPDSSTKLKDVDIQETCNVILSIIPDLYLCSEDSISNAVKLTVSSFSHKDVTTDVMFRILDVFVLHFKKTASLRNPSFDVN